MLDAWLLGDIGGTFSRFMLWEPSAELPQATVFRNAEFADAAELLAAAAAIHEGRARHGGFAVAGPVFDDAVRITNLGWALSAADIAARTGLEDAELINDFTAAAYGIPDVPERCLSKLGGGQPRSGAPIAVLGPGTGLGISGLLPCPSGWVAISGEGGHRSLAPATAREWQVLQAFAARHGHVSAERVLSGPGLFELYRTLVEIDGGEAHAASPEHVSAAAVAGSDPHATEALAMFFELLGSVAGDLVLTLGAHGGLYLAGGILPGLAEALAGSGFLARFAAKGRYHGYLEAIPVWLVDDPSLTFRGLVRWSRT